MLDGKEQQHGAGWRPKIELHGSKRADNMKFQHKQRDGNACYMSDIDLMWMDFEVKGPLAIYDIKNPNDTEVTKTEMLSYQWFIKQGVRVYYLYCDEAAEKFFEVWRLNPDQTTDYVATFNTVHDLKNWEMTTRGNIKREIRAGRLGTEGDEYHPKQATQEVAEAVGW